MPNPARNSWAMNAKDAIASLSTLQSVLAISMPVRWMIFDILRVFLPYQAKHASVQ